MYYNSCSTRTYCFTGQRPIMKEFATTGDFRDYRQGQNEGAWL